MIKKNKLAIMKYLYTNSRITLCMYDNYYLTLFSSYMHVNLLLFSQIPQQAEAFAL